MTTDYSKHWRVFQAHAKYSKILDKTRKSSHKTGKTQNTHLHSNLILRGRLFCDLQFVPICAHFFIIFFLSILVFAWCAVDFYGAFMLVLCFTATRFVCDRQTVSVIRFGCIALMMKLGTDFLLCAL